MIKLDSRIKDINDIQTILRYDVNCIGCKGYFFDEFVDTQDLSQCRYGELIDITTHDDRNDLCFKAEYEEGLVGFFRFFIPEYALKPVEKKYRPYTLAEWIDQHEIGEVIHYRSKLGEVELRHMYVGTRHSQGIKKIILKITLGDVSHTLDYLFEDYEIEVDGEWQPFGVINNEKK